MGSAKHTPGPWSVSGAHRRGYEAEVIVERNPDPKAHSAITVCDVPNPTNLLIDDATAQANARLIAAAPELLEALGDLMRDAKACDHTANPMVCRWCFARAAIAKAEGA
jgi:hypothetical protein